MKYSSLSDLLTIISEGRKLHISIHINSEYFNLPELMIPLSHKTHTRPFCNLAKATPKGFKLCFRCKYLANQKAKDTGMPFAGHCPYGLYEYARPVYHEGHLLCIIYIGNMITDESLTHRKLRYSSGVTGTNTAALLKESEHCLYLQNRNEKKEEFPPEVVQIADLIAGYILLLINQATTKPLRNEGADDTCYSYRVRELTDYIQANYMQNISLKQLAGIYFVNEKYLGRTFKKETGQSVHEYLNRIRMEKATQLLVHTSKPILEVALECGFGSLSHFIRAFKAHTLLTPTEYRARNY